VAAIDPGVDRDVDHNIARSCLDGPSAAMMRLREQLQRVAPYFRAVLLTGEAGTGASTAAAMLHEGSPARDLRLRRLSPEAAETYFLKAHTAVRAVIFLEDAEALSPAAQRGLLRWMRMRGAQQARVIAAAETDLRGLVAAGAFSADLATRLGGLRIALPALRKRREDIPAMLNGAVERAGVAQPALSDELIRAACAYEWPRNLVGMESVIAWLAEHREAAVWGQEDFEAACEACACADPGAAGPVRMIRLEEVAQQHIRAVLSGCFGNKQKTAEVLGISRSTLYRMLDAGAPCMLQRTG
jgi:DNA-binding NtrC family response regulator